MNVTEVVSRGEIRGSGLEYQAPCSIDSVSAHPLEALDLIWLAPVRILWQCTSAPPVRKRVPPTTHFSWLVIWTESDTARFSKRATHEVVEECSPPLRDAIFAFVVRTLSASHWSHWQISFNSYMFRCVVARYKFEQLVAAPNGRQTAHWGDSRFFSPDESWKYRLRVSLAREIHCLTVTFTVRSNLMSSVIIIRPRGKSLCSFSWVVTLRTNTRRYSLSDALMRTHKQRFSKSTSLVASWNRFANSTGCMLMVKGALAARIGILQWSSPERTTVSDFACLRAMKSSLRFCTSILLFLVSPGENEGSRKWPCYFRC